MRAFSLAAMVFGVCVGGCAAGPDFERPPAPALDSYAMTGDAAAAGVQLTPSASAPAGWWSALSPQLDALVNEALAHNRTLAEADANLQEARADADATRGGALPQANATAGSVRERINTQSFGFAGFPSPTLSLYSVGASVAFDFDIFGGRRRAIERDEARLTAQQARVDAAYLTVTGNVVRQAVLVAGLRAKVAAQEEIIAADQRVLDMVRRAIRVGGQPPAAANTIEAQVAEDQAAAPMLRQQLAEASHRLALFAGQAPSQWSAPDLDLAAFHAPETIPVSLPSELVRRRPDILAAEADVHAATAQIGVDTAALYPTLNIAASWTKTSIDPSTLFEGTSAGWSIGPGLTAPLFHGGALRAHGQRATAAQRAALAAYQETVLEAFVQVADVMSAIGNAQQMLAAQQQAVQTAEVNVRNAQFAYRNGAGTLLNVVDAQRQANRARLGAVDAQVAL
ncbi:MAG: efflux transporter outer membrane subunit, partial [Proteobacteria bacterium]|nr:efflux transporter outer membrane subunit [Pseudomonadota bacterium]